MAQADSIKPTPRGDFWGAISDALTQAADYLDPPLVTKEGLNPRRGKNFLKPLIDLMGTRGAAKEADNLAYGNAPMRIPELTNIPQFKRGRAEGVVDLVGNLPLGTVASGASKLAAAPALAAGAGAIRLGGAKDLLATHAFNPGSSKEIVSAGGLIGPSIGITSRAPNDYRSSTPQVVWKAGALKPENEPGSLINRDGYFANPTGLTYDAGGRQVFNPKAFKDDLDFWQQSQKGKFGSEDLRLGQGTTVPNSQLAAIMASPNFKDFASFEKDPRGAQTLRTAEGKRQGAWDDLKQELILDQTERGTTDPLRDMILRDYKMKNITGATPDWWDKASKAPSAMAELKILDMLPIDPASSFILAPTLRGMDRGILRSLDPFREAGFDVFEDRQFAEALTPEGLSYTKEQQAYKNLPKFVANDGTLDFRYAQGEPSKAFTEWKNSSSKLQVPGWRPPPLIKAADLPKDASVASIGGDKFALTNEGKVKWSTSDLDGAHGQEWASVPDLLQAVRDGDFDHLEPEEVTQIVDWAIKGVDDLAAKNPAYAGDLMAAAKTHTQDFNGPEQDPLSDLFGLGDKIKAMGMEKWLVAATTHEPTWEILKESAKGGDTPEIALGKIVQSLQLAKEAPWPWNAPK